MANEKMTELKVRVPEKMASDFKRRAARESRSVAEMIRDALDVGAQNQQQTEFIKKLGAQLNAVEKRLTERLDQMPEAVARSRKVFPSKSI